MIDVLQRLQVTHQGEFAGIFDDDDEECSKEKAKMWELVQGRVGRDGSGRLRAITMDDVCRWVDDPGVALSALKGGAAPPARADGTTAAAATAGALSTASVAFVDVTDPPSAPTSCCVL